MSISYLSGQTATISSTGLSVNVAYPGANTAGNQLIVAGRNGADLPTVFTDSKANVYVDIFSGLTEPNISDSYELAHVENCASGANTVTFTATGAGGSMRVIISEFSGLATSSSITGTPTSASGTSTSMASGSTTTTDADAVIIGIYGTPLGFSAITVTGSGTAIADVDEKLVMSYRIVSATGSYSATATIGSSDDWAAGVAGIKALAAGGAVFIPIIGRGPGLCLAGKSGLVS